MAKTLTKKMLIEYGIIEVTNEGCVIRSNGKRAKLTVLTKKHPYGKDTFYLGISVYDKSKPKKPCTCIENGKSVTREFYPRFSIPLARVVIAWHRGMIPGDLDADHIDGDTFNNHISNLRAITHNENLLNRSKSQSEIMLNYWRKKREAIGVTK